MCRTCVCAERLTIQAQQFHRRTTLTLWYFWSNMLKWYGMPVQGCRPAQQVRPGGSTCAGAPSRRSLVGCGIYRLAEEPSREAQQQGVAASPRRKLLHGLRRGLISVHGASQKQAGL